MINPAMFQRLEHGAGRRREIIRMFAEGETTQGIALALGLSVKTVEYHRAVIYRLLKLNNIASLTRWAIRHGLTNA